MLYSQNKLSLRMPHYTERYGHQCQNKKYPTPAQAAPIKRSNGSAAAHPAKNGILLAKKRHCPHLVPELGLPLKVTQPRWSIFLPFRGPHNNVC